MPIHLRQNQYKGVNAHLHSIFQQKDDEESSPSMWPAFHTAHIIYLAEKLNVTLPETYQAVLEQSLQIRTLDACSIRPRPDITIYSSQASPQSRQGYEAAVLRPTWIGTIEDTLSEPEEIFSIVIYDQTEIEAHRNLGNPVTRIELFSPANKPGGSYYAGYQSNRRIALQSRLVLVEIDYLHEKPSPIHSLPVYPNDANAYPYSITISDPRLPADSKSVFSFGFSVDMIIPTLNIPLVDGAFVSLAFDEVYQHTFEAGRWGYQVDYEQEPERIESYREDDQQRIRAVMRSVKEKSL